MRELKPDREFEGVIPPMIVPFDTDGKLDSSSFEKEANFLLSRGVDGISVGGSTGEGAMLTNKEIILCNELLVNSNSKKVPIYSGIIRDSTAEVLEIGRALKSIGVDVLLITPVVYHGATYKENFDFFRKLNDELKMPIIIYNVVSSNLISPSEFLEISKLEWIIGVKQVDPIQLAELVVLSENNFKVFAACDHLLFGCYASGACGMISALATVMPEACVMQWEAYKQGDFSKALEIQKILLPVVMSYFAKPYPSKVKALINIQNRSGGLPRHPLSIPDKACLDNMKNQFQIASSLISKLKP